MNKKPLRILLVDDDEDDYLIIKGLALEAILPRPEIEWHSQFDQAYEAITSARHDVYLIDYRLGEKNGLELLRSFDLQQRPEPFIILTGVGDESVERQAMEAGVADYLVKGQFESELLRRVIVYSLQRKRMEAQRIKHLVELNRSKDEFIAVTSHQLRTPATAVKQYLGILLEGYAGDLPEEQESIVKRAYASNDRQLKIVDDILRIAQLDLQKVELRPEAVDVRELVERCARDVKLTTDAREQILKLTLSDKPEIIVCDPVFTTMALSNILDNASKYSSHGTTIHLSTRRTGDFLQIAVADQGVGIGERDMGRLFKKFSRIDNRLSTEVGGTGLGLYWAKAIITMHHGDVTVDSELGKGSTFTITLPVGSQVSKTKAKIRDDR